MKVLRRLLSLFREIVDRYRYRHYVGDPYSEPFGDVPSLPEGRDRRYL